MEGTTCERRTRPLAPTKPPAGKISVKLLRGGPASHHRSLWDGKGENRWPRAGQVEEGNGVGGLVAGLSWWTAGGLEERRGIGLSGKARGDSVNCRGIGSGGGGCGRCGRGSRGWKR